MTAEQIEKMFDKLCDADTFATLPNAKRRSLLAGLTRIERLASKLPESEGESCITGGYSSGIYTCMDCADLAKAGAAEKDIKFLVEAGAHLASFLASGELTVHFST